MAAGAALMGVAWCGPADAAVIDVPWAGIAPTTLATSTQMSPAPNVPNIVKFLGITGTAAFYAGEGGTGRVYATVGGGAEKLLLELTPGTGNSALLSQAVAQAMAGTLTAIRLEIISGDDCCDFGFDEYQNLQLANGNSPTIFQFEVADTTIPEPASVLTFLFGLAGLGWLASGRKQQAARASA